MTPADQEVVSELRDWLARGAPDADPPALPPSLPAERLGHLYERHLLSDRRARGAYYSPPALVQPLVEAALKETSAAPLVLDPACGSGAFLLAAATWLSQRADAATIPACLMGIDKDPAAIAVARLSLAQHLAVPLSAVRGLRCGDALREQDLAPGSFDAILGNPPFLAEEGRGALFAALRRASKVAPYLQPRTDLSYLFCHLCLDLLRPGGRLGLIMPEGLLHADGASLLRRRLLTEARIDRLTLVELPKDALFLGAPGQRVCLLSLRKVAAPSHQPQVALLDAGGLRALHQAPTQEALLVSGGTLRVGTPFAEALCQTMERAGAPLGAAYHVSTGIQAGPSRLSEKERLRLGARHAGVFVLTDEEVAALDLDVEERALLRPFYLAGELPPLGPLPRARHHLLYLTPSTCPDLARHPALLRHFAPLRPLLARRRETRLGYRAYFHLHWPRQEDAFLSPKLLSVRQTPAFCASYAAGPSFVDLAANVIRLRPGAPFSLPALGLLLHSAPVDHYLRTHGKRKGPLLQVDGAPLSALPLPPANPALTEGLAALWQRLIAGPPKDEAAALRAEADRLAAAAYGLPANWAHMATL